MSDASRTAPEAANALPVGTRLGEFEVRGLLGVGGFGIVYLGFDHALEREVAIKEYMPASMAGRTEALEVSLHSRADAEVFALGLRSFVNEAKLLARFEHASLIKVYRFWEGNGTAYMAMPVLRGASLKQLRKSTNRAPDEALLRAILEPLLGAIETLHNAGVYHRDIAPDNIHIEPDGRPVLLDFGAARRVISDKTQTLTAILKPAYAPIEQYAEAGAVKQGAWTDLYALGATLHYMLLGYPPAPATARTVFDESSGLASMGLPGYAPEFLHVVDWMLAPRPADRPQSVAQLRDVLHGRAQPPAPRAAPAPAPLPDMERTVMVPRGQGAAPVPDLLIEPVLAHPAPAPALPQTVLSAPAPERSVPPPPRARSVTLPLLLLVGVAAAAGTALVMWPRGSAIETAAAASAPAVTASAPAVPAPAVAAATASTAAPAAAAASMAASGAAVASDVAPALAAPASTATVPPATPVSTAAPAASMAVTAPPRTTHPGAPSNTGQRAGAGPSARPSTLPSTGPNARPGAAPAPAPGTHGAPPPPAMPARNTAGANNATARGEGSGMNPGPAQAAPAAAPAASVPAAGTPAATAPGPASNLAPEARCGGRNPLSYFVCMERECLRAQFQNHPDCQAWRRNARSRDGVTGN